MKTLTLFSDTTLPSFRATTRNSVLKLLLRLFAVFGVMMMFAISGWGACSGTNTGTWNTSTAIYNKNNQTVQSDEADYYPITVTSTGTLNLIINNDDSSQDLTVTLYSDGTCSTSIWTQSVSQGNAFPHSENVAVGTYTVRLVGSSSNKNTDYDFSGSFSTPAPEINVISVANGGTDTSFGSANIGGGTIDKTYTIENTGAVALNLSGTPRVVIGGTNASDFTVMSQPSTPVAATNGTTTFIVRFDPSAVGSQNATISIANDDSNENPYNFSISGTGTSPTLSISPTTLATPEGDSAPTNAVYTVTLSTAPTSGTVTVAYAVSGSGANPATVDEDFTATSGTLTFDVGETTKPIFVPITGDTAVEPNETYTVTLSSPSGATIATATAIGTITNDDSYCKNNNLTTGFHIIDPDGGSNTNSFEIYCSADSPKKDLIALNNKNDSNNFIFTNISGLNSNYYSLTLNPRTEFQAIEINPYTLKVITSGVLTPTNSSDSTYKILGKGFSNINLIGTPFAINWDVNTTISVCDTTKLTRKGYHGQTVKINTLDYNGQSQCQIDSMQLKLLDDYTYLTYNGSEVLEKTCKEMAEAVPTDVLDSSTVQGHYWIDPNNTDRSINMITAMNRPIVAYCWYQTDLDYVWTFFLALDGKVTNTKTDLTNKQDTCSQKGLWPFVPNNESTFERVRNFLSVNKAEWDKYTGTNNEKFKAFNNNSNYYLSTEYNGVIWPYGSFGVYFPYNGNNNASGTYQKWGGTANSVTGWMSGSPMHNIQTITEDYPRYSDSSGGTRNYYSWGNYSNTDGSGGGNYAYTDTMGFKGWRSVLQDLNKTTDWFISRTGAGDNFQNAGSNSTSYYEPNGNYYANAWVNFLYDDQGRVRHLDDLNDKYPYYDYMCMAEDNYDFASRYGLFKGPFNVVEHSAVLSGAQYKDANLTTKIANGPMQFDVVLLTNDFSNIRMDYNVSAGIFFDDTIMIGSVETPRDLHYFGQISDFNATRFELLAPRWPSGVQTWSKASKRMFFEFKYCSLDTMKWTDCWTQSGNTATCKTGSESYCKTADSNDFAIRPKTFATSLLTPLPLKAGSPFSIDLQALNFLDMNTTDYNETVGGSFDANVTQSIAGCLPGTFKNSMITGWQFANGAKSFVDNNYSEVAVLDINITEGLKPCTSRFAAVDCNDTLLSDLTINENYSQLAFTPHHFDLNSSVRNVNNGSFTYLSNPYTAGNDFNMSGLLDLNITAKNAMGGTTQNYNTLCYAKAKDINITYTPVAVTNLSKISSQYLHDAIVIGDVNRTLGTNIDVTGVTKDIFTVDHNGSAVLHFKINYDRNETKLVDKFDFNITKIDVTTTDEVNATTIGNQNVTFVYGRVIPRDVRVFGDVAFSANSWYEIYNVSSLAGTTFLPSRNEALWYINSLHIDPMYGDANVTVVVTGANPANVTPNATNGVESYAFGAQTPPYSAKAHIDTDAWLWYGANALPYQDPDGAHLDCLTHPCFNINVVPAVGATGSAKTSNESTKSSKTTSRGTGWHSTSDYAPAIR